MAYENETLNIDTEYQYDEHGAYCNFCNNRFDMVNRINHGVTPYFICTKCLVDLLKANENL